MVKSRFTLIELLVVIAIITLLAAILFPALQAARQAAAQAVCSSNLRQTGLGVGVYLSDYRDVFNWTQGYGYNSHQNWPQRLWGGKGINRYLTEKVVCDRLTPLPCKQGEPNDWQLHTSDRAGFYGWSNVVCIYADYTSMVVDPLAGSWDNGYRNLYSAKCRNPSELFLWGDKMSYVAVYNMWTRGNMSGYMWLAHRNRAGVVFLDGHVEMATPERLANMGRSEFKSSSRWSSFPSAQFITRDGVGLIDAAKYKKPW